MTAPCRLYLIVQGETGSVDALSDALSGGDVASVLVSPRPDAAIEPAAAARMLDVARARNVAVLIDGDVELAAALGADGVHVDADESIYGSARRRLGADAIIGVACGASRHAAMTLGEMGADYVAFAPGPGQGEITAWWAELFEVPCVAWEVADERQGMALARLGADFISLAPEAWGASGGRPAAAVAAFGRLLRDARSAA